MATTIPQTTPDLTTQPTMFATQIQLLTGVGYRAHLILRGTADEPSSVGDREKLADLDRLSELLAANYEMDA